MLLVLGKWRHITVDSRPDSATQVEHIEPHFVNREEHWRLSVVNTRLFI